MEEEKYIHIVTKYSPMVYRIALHDCRNHADAEDVMQNVFFRLYRFDPLFEGEEHIKRWLIQVTVRESRRLFTKPFRKKEELLDEIQPGLCGAEEGMSAVLDKEEAGRILADVLMLPRKYRIVIYLYYYEEYTVKEIAGVLDKKESTIQTELWRARKKLREKWKEETGFDSIRRLYGNEEL